MFGWLKNWYASCWSYITLWYLTSSGTMWGKTELELGGIDVIKDSAEILAKSFSTIPSKSTSIALIGLIIVSQGVFLLGSGLVHLLSSRHDHSRRSSGKAHCLIGLLFLATGLFTSLYCTTLTKLLFI